MRTLHAAVAALALAAGSPAVLADSYQWVSIPGSINSRGLQGAATNTVITTAPTPALPAGAISWDYLTISGNLTKVAGNTFAAEACIEISGPGLDGSGGKVIIKPFENGSFTGTIPIPAGAATAIPETLANVGQTCTLRFFELYADNASGADSTWSNLSITLHATDGNNPSPEAFSRAIQGTAQDPDVAYDSSWLYKAGLSGGLLNFSTARVVDKCRIKGYGTAMNGWTSNLTTSPLHTATLAITAPRADGAGPVTWSVAPFGNYAASSSAFDITIDAPVPVLTGPGNTWNWELSANGAAAADGTRLAAFWMAIQPLTPDAPGATDLGVIRGQPLLGPAESTVVKSDVFFTLAHEVHWYTFTTQQACSDATGYWLDIHTQIPAGSPIADHELGLYTSAGVRVANDDDGGSNARSMLTFGQSSPVRAPVMAAGGPYPRDGHHGVLPAGVHYLAVPQFDAEFADTGWYVTSAGTLGGSIALEFRTNLPALPCGPADVGGQGGVQGGDGVLDNNDFIVFIDRFFAHAPSADVGSQGGISGADGQWNNNDFVVFINQFFAGCV